MAPLGDKGPHVEHKKIDITKSNAGRDSPKPKLGNNVQQEVVVVNQQQQQQHGEGGGKGRSDDNNTANGKSSPLKTKNGSPSGKDNNTKNDTNEQQKKKKKKGKQVSRGIKKVTNKINRAERKFLAKPCSQIGDRLLSLYRRKADLQRAAEKRKVNPNIPSTSSSPSAEQGKVYPNNPSTSSSSAAEQGNVNPDNPSTSASPSAEQGKVNPNNPSTSSSSSSSRKKAAEQRKVNPNNPSTSSSSSPSSSSSSCVSWWTSQSKDEDRKMSPVASQRQQQRSTGSSGDDERQHRNRQRCMVAENMLRVNPSSLGHLDQELEAFANYVRLTDDECACREYLIQRVRDNCKSLFGVDESQCQVFGSFAAKSVCTYESDIDLAIWGIVPPDSNNNNNNSNRSRRSSATTAMMPIRQEVVVTDGEKDPVLDDGEGTENKNSKGVDPNQKKKERILRWKQLIADYESSQLVSSNMKEGTVVVETTVKNEVVIPNEGGDISHDKDLKQEQQQQQAAPKGDNDDGSDEPLFVVDRVGIVSATTTTVCDSATGGKEAIVLKSSNAEVDDGGQYHNNDDDDSDRQQEDSDDDDDDDDTADKLEGLGSRRLDNHPSVKENLDDDDQDDHNRERFDDERPRKRPRGQSFVSLSSSTTCSEECGWNSNDASSAGVMEISCLVDGTANAGPPRIVKQCGPTGQARTKVINALYKLARNLGSYATNLHVRKKAKVPIINMVTHFGYDCDIAIGGQNGTDTSSYASFQASRFKSFSVVVIVLKVILSQKGLDKPFTGGLGSYRLYVLVAHHLERHLALGGSDTPAGALLAFFCRYGGLCKVTYKDEKIPQSARTPLHQDDIVQTTDGGSAELKSCFQLVNCVKLFRSCLTALLEKLRGKDCWDRNSSMLQYIIDASKLHVRRHQSRVVASTRLGRTSNTATTNNNEVKSSPSRNQHKLQQQQQPQPQTPLVTSRWPRAAKEKIVWSGSASFAATSRSLSIEDEKKELDTADERAVALVTSYGTKDISTFFSPGNKKKAEQQSKNGLAGRTKAQPKSATKKSVKYVHKR